MKTLKTPLCLLILSAILLSCQYTPELAKAVEDIETDTAIKIEVSRETVQKDTDVSICIDILNKNAKQL